MCVCLSHMLLHFPSDIVIDISEGNNDLDNFSQGILINSLLVCLAEKRILYGPYLQFQVYQPYGHPVSPA